MDDDAPPGVPEWVVTYGDMMSLLLTFFIMLVSLSEVKAESRYRAMLEALQKYLGYAGSVAAPEGESFPLNSLLSHLETLGAHTDTEVGSGGVTKKSVEGEDVQVRRRREGSAVRAGQPVMFAKGSSILSEASRAGVLRIANELAGKPHKISIRGYVPFDPETGADPGPELRRLAFLRCRSVWKTLCDAQIAVSRLRITVMTTRPADDPTAKDATPMDGVEVFVTDLLSHEITGERLYPN